MPVAPDDARIGVDGDVPAVVIRPIEPCSPPLVNHNAPSGPAVMPIGSEMPASV